MTTEDLHNRFTYHKPDPEKAVKHREVRDAIQDLAETLDIWLPDGREKTLVLIKLEEAMFWANASIARTGN